MPGANTVYLDGLLLDQAEGFEDVVVEVRAIPPDATESVTVQGLQRTSQILNAYRASAPARSARGWLIYVVDPTPAPEQWAQTVHGLEKEVVP
ncbi:hypothetical protein GKE82_04785 [Conexibacter sp. W3-3-2]|uniref:hypothetical protein n=1 Tax=Conexibacter sp. W3-3-2 TaxID=2675227 RepID=UPI0012B7B6A8|nr:hypothetical protein [Conexibacter sp. W3-3-2]MTD43637.1 hypothetical protein [Conexibacter sp. W3-3-2]